MTYSVLFSGPRKERGASWRRDDCTSSPTFEVRDGQVTDLKFPKEKAEPAASPTCLCLAFHTDPEHLPVFVGEQMKTTKQMQCRVYILTVIVTISGVLVT